METIDSRFSLNSLFSRFRSFWSQGLWQEEATGFRGFFIKSLRVLLLSLRGLLIDRALIRASALAYLTGLALIPLLALLFAILTSLGIQRLLATHLLEHLAPGSKDFALQILQYIESTNVASLGVFVIVALLADLIILMTNIERAFNDTWQVDRTRPWRRKLSDYLTIFLILPILMAVAISIATNLLSHPVISLLVVEVLPEALMATTSGLVSLGLFGMAFTFIYLVMPNTRVHFLSAIIGGLVGAFLWQGAQIFMAWLHTNASYYNAIYGVVYHLLFFVLWMYWSWLIVLFGNEVAYVHQNLERLSEQRRHPSPTREPVDEYVALAALVAIAGRFLRREPPLDLEELGQSLANGNLLASRVVETLKDFDLILEVAPTPADGPPRYVPARPLDQISVGNVLNLLRQARGGAVARVVAGEPGLANFLRRLVAGPATSPWDNLNLQELVNQAAADPESAQ
jgi:membrane protein